LSQIKGDTDALVLRHRDVRGTVVRIRWTFVIFLAWILWAAKAGWPDRLTIPK